MYNNELELFQRTNETIWTDDYISKTLLEAHLDESHDAASRKAEKRADILNWINGKIKPNSKILDLGCGPGFYTYEFGKLGHNLLGIDFNKASLNYAEENKKIDNLIEYRHCNYLEDSINGKYDVVIMIYCDFGALIPKEQKILLQKIKNVLTDDGIFIFGIFGKSVLENKKDERSWYISQGNDFWSNEPYILMTERKIFKDENSFGTRYYLINQKTSKIKEYILWDQYYDNDSIKKLMSENDFNVIEFKKDLLNSNEETLFIIANKF